MINPNLFLHVYLKKLINHFVFIKHIYDDLNLILAWGEKPDGINALIEGASFFNLVQRTFTQTLLIELCKFISDDEEKSLLDFLDKLKENVNSLEVYNTETKKVDSNISAIPSEKYTDLINNNIAKFDKHRETIRKLKAHRDKALAHTDSSFFDNPEKHFEKYAPMAEDINGLLKTIEEILWEQALYLLTADYDFTTYTTSGIDRVLEFMRAYFTIVKENSEYLKYRFDEYYKK